MKSLLRSAVPLALLAITSLVDAAPNACTPGYQDATCRSPLYAAHTAPPACPSGAGWTTVSPAVWKGSHWSQPACSYQSPPSCPSGYQQSSAPWWNGSSWVGLGCTLPPAPQATQAQQQQACANVAASYGKYVNSPSAFSGPQSETTNQVVNDINTQPPPRICEAPGTGFGSSPYGGLPPTNGPYDVYKIGFGTYVQPNIGGGDDGYVYGSSSQIMACMLNPGTTQVVGFRISQSQNATGGPCGR